MGCNPTCLATGRLPLRAHTCAADERLLRLGPPTWSPASASAVGIILRRLGWMQGNRRVSLLSSDDTSEIAGTTHLTVRSATQLLMQPTERLRHHARQQCVQWAPSADSSASVTVESIEAASSQLAAAMRDLWHLRWENHRKETLLRLSVHGASGAGGHGLACSGPCVCG